MGASIKQAAEAIRLGESFLKARAAVDAIKGAELHEALLTGAITRAAIAAEAGVSPSTVGYHALAWEAAALEADGVPYSSLLMAAVACHKTRGTGVAAASVALATCKTQAQALRKMQSLVAEATKDTTATKAKAAPAPKKGTDLVKSASESLAKAIKEWDGTVTTVQAALVADLVATLVAKATPVASTPTVTTTV